MSSFDMWFISMLGKMRDRDYTAANMIEFIGDVIDEIHL